ncbi:hypothetical protein A2Z67_03715 [Candidatus Woesebacteria bacterium RBG_13_36_22]|uniref:Uncharacterized protein n=1 Tax=Candidatus Woesebacteria bacterium RBG_13_36_22 TaxID=1802478 RepID=A0A1F7X162_9BACT|nr:MAG: hypothetical protein A2Z67_03715 [Candidatus Woesebacteria bacterium RBG_13_36_22]
MEKCERCRHGLIVETCSLCLGQEQTEGHDKRSGNGTPGWFLSQHQFDIQRNYPYCKGRCTGEYEIILSTVMPRGCSNKEVKTLLPYKRKPGKDTKARRMGRID